MQLGVTPRSFESQEYPVVEVKRKFDLVSWSVHKKETSQIPEITWLNGFGKR